MSVAYASMRQAPMHQVERRERPNWSEGASSHNMVKEHG